MLCEICKNTPKEATLTSPTPHGGLWHLCVDCAAELEEQAYQDYIAEQWAEDEVTNQQYTKALERDGF